VEIVDVSEELIPADPDCRGAAAARGFPVSPGCSSAPRYPGDPRQLTLMISSRRQLREVENLHDFAGMLVFDKWTCNTNGARLFFSTTRAKPRSRRHALQDEMIDQGFCFNAGNGIFPDAPLRGLRTQPRLPGRDGMESFAPWLERIEKQIRARPG